MKISNEDRIIDKLREERMIDKFTVFSEEEMEGDKIVTYKKRREDSEKECVKDIIEAIEYILTGKSVEVQKMILSRVIYKLKKSGKLHDILKI